MTHYLSSASDRLDLLVKREAVVTATDQMTPERFSEQFQDDQARLIARSGIRGT
jgi:hypothetical protein